MQNKRVIDTRDLLKAFSLHLSGNEKQAQAIYHDILGFDVNHPDFFYIIGSLAHSIGECETAVFFMNQAIQNTPERSQYYQSLGEIYKDLRKYQNAQQCFQKALELDSARSDTLVSLGNMAHLQGKFNQAETDYLNLRRIHLCLDLHQKTSFQY